MDAITLSQYAPGGIIEQLNSAIGATIARTSNASMRRKVIVLGDSISANALATPTVHQSWTNVGYVAWLRRFLGQRITLPVANVLAVGGKNISWMVANELPAALSSGADIAIVHCGSNSIGIAPYETAATMIAGLTQTYTSLLNAGMFVVAIPIRTRGASNLFPNGAADLLKFSRVNRFIADFCAVNSGTMLFDVNPTYLDFSTGQAQASLLVDGLHDNQIGAMTMGKLLSDALSPLIPMTDDRFMHLGDTFDATNNYTGNMMANGLLAGTGGMLTNGATGAVPNSWTGQRATNSGTLTAAFSSIADATLVNLTRSRMTLGGTADGNTAQLVQTSAGWNVGDTVTAEADCSWNITANGITALGLQIVCFDAAFNTLDQTHDGYYGGVGGNMPASGTLASGSVVYRTDPLKVPATTAYVNVICNALAPASGAITATVDWGRISLRRVE